jgi:PAS domain S-box-containing protein
MKEEVNSGQSDRVECPELESQVERLSRYIGELKRTIAPLTRLKAVIDQADEAILVIDPDTNRFVDANETALRWLGLTHTRLLSLTTDEVDVAFPLEYPKASTIPDGETRNCPRPVVCGRTHRRRDGTAFPVEVAVTQVHMEEHLYTLVVARQNRQQQQVEVALREAEEKYHTLFNLTSDIGYLTANDGRIAAVNEAAVENLGYGREELIGRRAWDFYDNPPDARELEASVERSGFVRGIAVRLRTKDGSPISGMLTATAWRRGSDSEAGFQCLVQTVEERSPLPAPESNVDEPPDSTPVVLGKRVLLSEPVDRNPKRRSGFGKRAHRHHQRVQPRSPSASGHFRLWPLFLALGAVVAVCAWTPVAELVYPHEASLAPWRLALQALALSLVAVGVVGRLWPGVARVVAVGSLLVALVFSAVCVGYLLSLPFELRSVVPETETVLNRTIFEGAGFVVALVLFCGWLARRLWTGAREQPAEG